jgi:hypothetical protein
MIYAKQYPTTHIKVTFKDDGMIDFVALMRAVLGNLCPLDFCGKEDCLETICGQIVVLDGVKKCIKVL